MKTQWFKGLNEQDAKEMKGLFIQSLRLRDQFINLLNTKVEEVQSGRLQKIAYQDASWGYYQADSIGYERALREVISLLEDDKK